MEVATARDGKTTEIATEGDSMVDATARDGKTMEIATEGDSMVDATARDGKTTNNYDTTQEQHEQRASKRARTTDVTTVTTRYTVYNAGSPASHSVESHSVCHSVAPSPGWSEASDAKS